MTTYGLPRPPRAAEGGLAGVVAAMRALDRALPPGDGVAVFNSVYLTVTQEIAGRLAAGAFADPYAAGELAARFAGRYLAAVTPATARPASTPPPGGRSTPRTPTQPHPCGGHGRPAVPRRSPACWRALLRVRADRRVLPVQFALAGINAHVGHDLALAVVDTCRAAGCGPERLREDFDRVGAVLTAMEMRVREQLMPGPDLLETADPLTHRFGAWSLARGRDAAWAAARLLWVLRDTDDAFEECTQALDAWVAAVGRLILAPVARQSSPSPSRTSCSLPPRTTSPSLPAIGQEGPIARPLRQLMRQSSGNMTGAISS